jgi:predicted transport protein
MALHVRAAKQVRGGDVYHAFRPFFLERQEAVGLEEALKDMLRFARYHGAFALGRTPPPRLTVPLARLNRLAEVAAILVMKLYDFHDRARTLSEADFAESLACLESYVFRRAVCGLQTRGYWQVFASLAYRLQEAEPLGSLKVLLHQLRESYRFVADEQFARDLTQRDIYGMRVTHYLLERLENHDTKEPTDTTDYSIEHILPQNENLVPAWREMLGPDWAAIQKTWLHRLGNLTLTGYNSNYSDLPFEKKKTKQHGLRESSVRLNRWVADQPTWTAAEIETRGETLAKLAIEVWPPLVVSEGAIRAMKEDDLRKRAAAGDLASIEMSAQARELFDLLRPRLLALHASLIEVPETHSVVYHAADGDFFLEVLPRTNRLVLLLNLELSECEHRDANLSDTTEWKFVVNAKQDGGVAYRLHGPDDLDGAMKVVRQAHDLAAQ